MVSKTIFSGSNPGRPARRAHILNEISLHSMAKLPNGKIYTKVVKTILQISKSEAIALRKLHLKDHNDIMSSGTKRKYYLKESAKCMAALKKVRNGGETNI